jgi:hypothetical protein
MIARSNLLDQGNGLRSGERTLAGMSRDHGFAPENSLKIFNAECESLEIGVIGVNGRSQ